MIKIEKIYILYISYCVLYKPETETKNRVSKIILGTLKDSLPSQKTRTLTYLWKVSVDFNTNKGSPLNPTLGNDRNIVPTNSPTGSLISQP